MHTAEFWRWVVTDEVTGKRRKTRHHMTESDALASDPTAERVPGTMEIRQVPDGPQDWAEQSTSAWQRSPAGKS